MHEEALKKSCCHQLFDLKGQVILNLALLYEYLKCCVTVKTVTHHA